MNFGVSAEQLWCRLWVFRIILSFFNPRFQEDLGKGVEGVRWRVTASPSSTWGSILGLGLRVSLGFRV